MDKLLKIGEAVIVLTISVAVVLFLIRQIIWVAFPDVMTRTQRVEQTIKMLNDNWKAGLLIILPLFYRTIRIFLEQVEEIAGMKRPTQGQPQQEPNPKK